MSPDLVFFLKFIGACAIVAAVVILAPAIVGRIVRSAEPGDRS